MSRAARQLTRRRVVLLRQPNNAKSIIVNTITLWRRPWTRFTQMIPNPPGLQFQTPQDPQAWIDACAWAVDQMPLPGFLCDFNGCVLKCNALTAELWGAAPDPNTHGLWHGWEELLGADSLPLRPHRSPAERAINRCAATSMDVVVRARGDVRLRATVFSRPILDKDSKPVGAICAVSISGPADPSQAEERAMFLSILSHELRNPLSPIMTAAALLRMATADPKIIKMAETVDRQSKQLARFLADLLDASRLHRAREVPCEMHDADLGAVIDAALDPLGPTLLSRRQSLSTNPIDRAVKLRCDPARVAQAIANILRNASHHSPDGADIALSVYPDDDTLVIVVDDCGAGIEADLIPRAAEPFVQGAPAAGRAPAGAGLGLAIARSVCVAHGGRMTLGAVGTGRGARIELILPIVAPCG